jgi:2'-5' RNA ligase
MASAQTNGKESAMEKPITAIDIALDPDRMMMLHAKAINARLRKGCPDGFALDKTHQPHITILHRYVRTADLGNIYAAVGMVLANKKASDLELKAVKYVFHRLNDLGIVTISVETSVGVLKLQQELIDAVYPFEEKMGTAAAFFTTPNDPDIDQMTIDYVAEFVPKRTGQKFHPHVTVGIASQDYGKKLLTEPFDTFTFSSAQVSVYQLGNKGTARKTLKSWKLMP